ncbi:MAG: hypothetical protein LKJ86_03895 [Oscillibacter sp.]|nr:hypothetical protein [Oscillibacter sp.]
MQFPLRISADSCGKAASSAAERRISLHASAWVLAAVAASSAHGVCMICKEDNMNIYSELLELLTPRASGACGGCFGTLKAIAPLTVAVGGTDLTDGLHRLTGQTFANEDVGCTLALLNCGDGFLILGKTEGV